MATVWTLAFFVTFINSVSFGSIPNLKSAAECERAKMIIQEQYSKTAGRFANRKESSTITLACIETVK